MPITLNGDVTDWPGPLSIAALLLRLGIDPRVVAVERNRIVVKRTAYADTLIVDGDEVEIVAFVGGGQLPPAQA